MLFGDLGLGKTHFIKGIAKGLGIEMTIKSPTYAYVNQYPIEGPIKSPIDRNSGSQSIGSSMSPPLVFYHYDLYRFSEGNDLSSIGYDESLGNPTAINAVEWADRLGGHLPRTYVKVGLEGGAEARKISIEFIDPRIPTKLTIHQLYDEWATPQHVRAHIKQVTHVAIQLAQAFIEQGEIINVNLLYAASMLHDISRVCDFSSLDRNQFKEEVTDEKWKKWQACRRDYKGMHHADIAFDQFTKLGFSEVAEVVRLHKSLNIVDEPDSYDTLEKKILYYADKRVKHDEIVDLDERFRDGRERYGKYDDRQTRERFEQVEKKTRQLEKELFKGLKIGPKDIK